MNETDIKQVVEYIRELPGTNEYRLRQVFRLNASVFRGLTKRSPPILRSERIRVQRGEMGYNSKHPFKIVYYVNLCDNLDENGICCNPFQKPPFSARCPENQTVCPGFNAKREKYTFAENHKDVKP